jgi:hypothetical protein
VDPLNLCFTPYPTNTGVFGAGDNFGVYGQNRASDSQRATQLPAPGNVGVYGVGDTVGVQGDSDHTAESANGTDIGTGVVGTSIQGIGVLGEGTGGTDYATGSIPPYIGVHGLSQINPVLPYPAQSAYSGTGQLGVGDVRGGIFEATPNASAETFANVRFSPLHLAEQKPLSAGAYAPGDPPALPSQGAPGDILAVQTTDAEGHASVELWICIRPAHTEGDHKVGAIWARLQFEQIATMPPPT